MYTYKGQKSRSKPLLMSHNQRAKTALALALLLLGLSGAAAGFVIDRLSQAEAMVHHTYDVEVAIGDLESSLTGVGRSRVAYLDSPSEATLGAFQSSVAEVGSAMARIRQLTVDNPVQQEFSGRLQKVADERISTARQSVELVETHQSDPEKQLQITFAAAKNAYETAAITRQMRDSEDALLRQRNQLSRNLFDVTLAVLALSFLSSALMFRLHYKLLSRELEERRGAENQLRQLSLQLIRAQDEERRRFARELHDGLGQTLVGAKMLVDTLLMGSNSDPAVNELVTLLNDAISQTRTISYLFHPPLLDEAGFASAARWLVEGYGQRMGMEIRADFSQPAERLPHSVEITFYRVLQEALNNIYRHAHSSKAEVSLKTDEKWITLSVRDFGRGIPAETLSALRTNTTKAGVGLTGMRERVREQGGQLEIHSDENGTEIIAKIPVGVDVEPVRSATAESILNAG